MSASKSDLKPKGIELLREKFPEHQISLLPKPTKKDAPKGKCNECGGYHGLPAVHLKYVGHAALTDRLLDADPLWNWEPMGVDERGLPLFDQNGGLWIRLTVCGHTRLGYGNAAHSDYKDPGATEKEIIGDALRNAAMRFGAALDLWHKGDLHLDDEKDFDQAPKVNAPGPVLAQKPAGATVPNTAAPAKAAPPRVVIQNKPVVKTQATKPAIAQPEKPVMNDEPPPANYDDYYGDRLF